MKNIGLATLCVVIGLLSSLPSFTAFATVYNDPSNDIFDNGLGNLDITSVEVTNDSINLKIAVTTRSFANWTKYFIWVDTPTRSNAAASSNGWGRPANLTSGEGADFFIGSWVDTPTSNAQLWTYTAAPPAWSQHASSPFSNSTLGNTVTFTIPLSALGLSVGNLIKFDVATSGGGNGDPGVDHASRPTSATSGWGASSTAGPMLSYAVAGDAIPPVVNLTQPLIALAVGTAYSVDSGATAIDVVDGNVTASMTNDSATVLTSSVRSTPGTYTVTYSAKDAASNIGSATQTVVVYHPAFGFASQYTSVAAPGLFNNWTSDGSRQNRFYPYGNFRWRLIYYFEGAAATNSPYLVTANNGYAIKWGAGGIRGAGDASLNPTVDAAGWYVFELNELTDSASFAKLPATADADADGMPDVWESFFGSQLTPPVSNLEPFIVYNEFQGGIKSAKQAYDTGDNPVSDAVPPVVALAWNVAKFTSVGLNSLVTLAATDVTASDTVTAGYSLFYRIKVDGTVVDLGNPLLNTSTQGLRLVTYEVFDQANNMASVDRVIAVGDPEPNWRKLVGPSTNTILPPAGVSLDARIYIAGVTPGSGQAPFITAEVGIFSENTNPAFWTATGVWRSAIFNPSFTGGDDEYTAWINWVDLPAGTYYTAYRFKIDNGAWRYAGINAAGTDGGPWDGANHGNGTLVVSPLTIGYANIQLPSSATIGATDSLNIYAQVYVGGITESAGEPTQLGFRAQIGYHTNLTAPVTDAGWTWLTAAWNAQTGNNDEYLVNLYGLSPGNYVYASRFSLDGGTTWTHGGVNGSSPANPATDYGQLTVLTPFAGWSGGGTLNSANLAKYAFGGASSLTATDGKEPTVTTSGGDLVMTVIVRTDDPKLSAVGRVTTSLAPDATETTVSGVEGADQSNVPAGCKRMTFSVPRGSDSRKFLRVTATLQP